MPVRTKKPSPRPKRSRKPPGSLQRYHAKRNLAISGEPGGRATDRARATVVRKYVIQKHDATRLHYDFRLEMAGVLRSWAVPKGLPTKAGERALAVEVEDHPLAYGSFEGTIPKGNYGGGTVMLWDRGDYTVAEGSPEEAFRRGKIHLALSGQKCVGEWTLVRMHARPGDRSTTWLLIKNSGATHKAPMSGAERDVSVSTGRSMGEIAEGKKRARSGASHEAAKSAKGQRSNFAASRLRVSPARKQLKKKALKSARGAGAPADFIPPMKALSVDAVPAGEWRLEVKLDGYRAVAVLNGEDIALWSRNHKPLTDDYPEVVDALRDVRCANAVLDGEIVALDAEGRSRFQLLQGRSLAGRRPAIVYYVFDLLHHDGSSLIDLPIEERQGALEKLLGSKSKTIRLSPVFTTKPDELLAAVRKQGLEGIIAKAAHSRYEPDRRSGTWLKCKVQGEQEFVIGGFTPPKNSRPYIGAILVGVYDKGKLLYAGKVGSGFDHRRLKALHDEFRRRETASCPFTNLPTRAPRYGAGMTAGEMRKVTWVKPELVAQVRFTEWTDDGLLRHPVFLGLREDKDAKDVVRETA